jgi:hypothetical protein
VGRAAGRDLRGLESIKVNNFFLFVALLVWGAAVSGVEPASAEPFLALMALVLLVPLSADPLARVPAARLGLWPLSPVEHVWLRAGSLALNPLLWMGTAALCWTRWTLGLVFLAAASGAQWLRWRGEWRVRWAPWLPTRYAMLVRNKLRQILSTGDFYLATLIAVAGAAWRVASPSADPNAFPLLGMLVALALSTGTQGLFGLDGAGGASRYRLLPLRGREILVSKDAAHLGALLVLVAPLHVRAGMTFGIAALAIGHFSSVKFESRQERWRLASGRLTVGVTQMLAGGVLALAGWKGLVAAGVALAVSVVWCGRVLENRDRYTESR